MSERTWTPGAPSSNQPIAEPEGRGAAALAAAPARWSFPLGSALGVRVDVHLSLVVLLGLIALAQLGAGRSAGAAAGAVALVAALFGCVLLHELGHALAARRCGVATRAITLLPIGGVAQLERMPERPRDQLVVALAGPAVNAALALAFGALLLVALAGVAPGAETALRYLVVANAGLAVFNLLPALPMDGGRVLRALLAMRMAPLRATEVAGRVGQALALGMGLVGLALYPLLALVAVFVWSGASSELRAARVRAALAGKRVADAMEPEAATLERDASVRSAVEGGLRQAQGDYAVVDRGRLVGLVSRDELARALADGRGGAVVGAVMRAGVPSVERDDPLALALERGAAARLGALPVVDGERVVGLVTHRGVGELLALRRRAA